ncbi:MAG: transglycosylase family protein [Acidimicrobiales bacterium]
MTDVEVDSTAKSATQVSCVGYALRSLLLVALATSITFPVVFFARPAWGDQISDLRAQATQLSQSMIREQLEVGADQQQSLMTTDKVDQDNQLIAQTEKWVARDEHRLTVDREQLQREAISNYVDFGYSSDATTMFQSQAVTLIKKEYQDVAFGDTAVAIDQMNTESNVVEAERSWLRHQEAVDQGLQQQAAELLDQAQNAQGQLQNQQSQVNSQLAAAIAQQQAAAAAQAAAARAAALAVVAAPLVVTGSPAPASSAAPGDPGLNGFLSCVVQAESTGNYGAISPGGTYMGAFQFSQSTWNEAATLAGLPSLVGVAPNSASKADQDTLAVTLFNADGQQPWDDSCRS